MACLAAGDPPGHRRLRHQERAGDLGRGQAADRAQGQCDLRGGRQCGVAAQEQQDQCVVGVGRRVGPGGQAVAGRDLPGSGLLPALPGLLRAQEVGQPTGGDGDQPAAWTGGDSVGRPLARGGEQRLLDGVLGEVEMPVSSCQRAEDLRREVAQQVLDPGPWLGHISRPVRAVTPPAAGRPRTPGRGRARGRARCRAGWRCRSPGPGCRTPRSSTRPAPPRPRRTGRR